MALDPNKKSTSRVGSGTVVQKKEDTAEVFLTAYEMNFMSELSYQKRLDQAEIDKHSLMENNLILQIQKMQVELELHRVKYASLNSTLQNTMTKVRHHISTLKSKYNIQAEKFSYHPDTGKLILEELV